MYSIVPWCSAQFFAGICRVLLKLENCQISCQVQEDSCLDETLWSITSQSDGGFFLSQARESFYSCSAIGGMWWPCQKWQSFRNWLARSLWLVYWQLLGLILMNRLTASVFVCDSAGKKDLPQLKDRLSISAQKRAVLKKQTPKQIHNTVHIPWSLTSHLKAAIKKYAVVKNRWSTAPMGLLTGLNLICSPLLFTTRGSKGDSISTTICISYSWIWRVLALFWWCLCWLNVFL